MSMALQRKTGAKPEAPIGPLSIRLPVRDILKGLTEAACGVPESPAFCGRMTLPP